MDLVTPGPLDLLETQDLPVIRVMMAIQVTTETPEPMETQAILEHLALQATQETQALRAIQERPERQELQATQVRVADQATQEMLELLGTLVVLETLDLQHQCKTQMQLWYTGTLTVPPSEVAVLLVKSPSVGTDNNAQIVYTNTRN